MPQLWRDDPGIPTKHLIRHAERISLLAIIASCSTVTLALMVWAIGHLCGAW